MKYCFACAFIRLYINPFRIAIRGVTVTLSRKSVSPSPPGEGDSGTVGGTIDQKSMFEVVPLNVLVGKGLGLGIF